MSKAAPCVLSCCTHGVKASHLYDAFFFRALSRPVLLLFCEQERFFHVMLCKRAGEGGDVPKEILGS